MGQRNRRQVTASEFTKRPPGRSNGIHTPKNYPSTKTLPVPKTAHTAIAKATGHYTQQTIPSRGAFLRWYVTPATAAPTTP